LCNEVSRPGVAAGLRQRRCTAAVALTSGSSVQLKLDAVFSTKVTERFKISSDPIGKDGDATLNQFSPAGEIVSYTAQASELWITDGMSSGIERNVGR
jgi:hypothetical protein